MPSNAILEAKKATVAELSEKIKASPAGVVVSYTGITVDVDTKMRTELRNAGVDYKVYKNSITSRAAEIAGYPEMNGYLVGMNALAISGRDPVAAAKILKGYSEKIEKFELVCGYVDGKLIDAAGVLALAEIPSKEALIARMLGSIMSPLYKTVYGLQAIIDKSGESGETAAAPAAAEEGAEAPAAAEAVPAVAEEAAAEAPAAE